jgi:hypothetical protein
VGVIKENFSQLTKGGEGICRRIANEAEVWKLLKKSSGTGPGSDPAIAGQKKYFRK